MNFRTIKAIRVTQPFGEFYICKFKAGDLLEVTFPDPLRFINDSGELVGSQRILDDKRVEEIAAYIKTVDVAFPNSIIVAANYGIDGLLCEDVARRWMIKKTDNPDIFDLVIPTNEKLASIIDGQHRLNGFIGLAPELQNIELVCSVYLDLPNPFQAQIFATINFNQKKVDKSLAYEQFGFNLDKESSESWSPEKLAVWLTRKLNKDDDKKSAFYNHIILAPQDDDILFEKKAKDLDWAVSTSTVVDCIIRLFSTNHKRDKYELHKFPVEERKRNILKTDSSPFRSLYLGNNDLVIYTAIFNYFEAANELLINKAPTNSYIKKTVGIQGLFDVLRSISNTTLKENKDISKKFYASYLTNVSEVDFSDNYYQASGVGRSRIRNTISLANNLITNKELKQEDVDQINRLLKK